MAGKPAPGERQWLVPPSVLSGAEHRPDNPPAGGGASSGLEGVEMGPRWTWQGVGHQG